ncbi:hypothetical protein NXS98_09885 [Fontisphaera persica]|uniref:beta-ketoacyl synthase N-terminal-like domain-containing protein n=1 Tax=Fontisphaera persica TaxID=2974023 RepID=UPI0024C0D19B|nr:beta-ketoacyl synthase N-terminal-like domain-containing protein [Fontisphaera persica]WCJ58036.1 hypothetical protein NXS98_09885 [Fontisphaera persica]
MSNPGIYVQGVGAVSPAGWGVAALREAVQRGEPLPVSALERPGWSGGLAARKVPPAPVRPAFMAHPRLRRASSISHFTVAAALEALGHPTPPFSGEGLGIIFCTMAGPLNYTRRFFAEALKDPATASPMLFPETVLNAPASHLAALLGVMGPVYTLIGDDTAFLSGLALAAQWLSAGRVERCLVVAAEELDWLPADAFRLFLRGHIASEGAGAILLSRQARGLGAQLAGVSEPFNYALPGGAAAAMLQARRQVQAWDGRTALLCDSRMHLPRHDRAENQAWHDWPGRCWSPRHVLGNALTAASAWQAVLAAAAVPQEAVTAAVVSVAGCNHQAMTAVWTPA